MSIFFFFFYYYYFTTVLVVHNSSIFTGPIFLISNIYFTSDFDAESRISNLNEFSKINLNETRRAGDNNDGVFKECKLSDQEYDDEIASINSKDNDDDAADDDDD